MITVSMAQPVSGRMITVSRQWSVLRRLITDIRVFTVFLRMIAVSGGVAYFHKHNWHCIQGVSCFQTSHNTDPVLDVNSN